MAGTRGTWCGALVAWWVVVGAGLIGPRVVLAQPSADEMVATDPIRCWWRTDRPAIRIGERFQLLLSCAVIEVSDLVVEPTLTDLDPSALTLPPFEVVDGRRAGDVLAPPWRYVQYEYDVRLLAEGFFGQDVTIPGLAIRYAVRTGEIVGREQSYQLPGLPIRLVSLVPSGLASGVDIRDDSGRTFEMIAARRFRSAAALVAAWISVAFAGVLLLSAVVQRARRGRVSGETPVVAVAPAAILGACRQRLNDVASAADSEWTPELARRAAAACRVAAAVALNRPVAQTRVASSEREHDGQIDVRTGWLRPQRVLLSAAQTASSMEVASRHDAARQVDRDGDALRLADALRVLDAVGYGRDPSTHIESMGSASTLEIGDAVAAARDAVAHLHRGARWPARAAAKLAAVVSRWRAGDVG